MVTYAGVNLTKSTTASRSTISKMLQQVTTTGQEQGTAIGQLPVGYVPLDAALSAEALAATGRIATWQPPRSTTVTNTTAGSSVPSQAYSGQSAAIDPTAAEVAVDPTLVAGADQLSDARTPASAAGPLNASLAIALIVGLLGFLLAPVILRGRGLL
jgi:hypothetical protein